LPETVSGFQDIEPEFRHVIRLAEERNHVSISPLQELAGGWSGAAVYLVRVASADTGSVEHVILKLDRKRPKASSDEISRHQAVLETSPLEFARAHIPEMAFDRIESDDVMAIFYAIAGQSLLSFRTLSSYARQSRLEVLFSATCRYILGEWNEGHTFRAVDHPAGLLQKWLGFRLEPGQKIERFLVENCRLSPDTGGFIVDGSVLPNPLKYARHPEDWGSVRGCDSAIGFQHGDLNTNNILARFSRAGDALEGYYLIDFSLFKEDMPLFYDLRYLEMSYLAHVMGRGVPESVIELISRFSRHDLLEADDVPIDVAGVNAVVRSSRYSFEAWVQANHPSLQDDLWGQYWLGGTAAGLNFCHKAGQPIEIRLAGLIFAAANLKRYFELFEIPMPSDASQLFASGQTVSSAETRSGPALAEAGPANNLPVPLTSLVGRTRELADLADLLSLPEVRLVSLTGPGGTGKTRLAIETGRNLLGQFRDGVFFVDLAQINDPAFVKVTIAHAMGIREGGGRLLLETLQDYLSTKNLLLILDNLEQVIQAAKDISALIAEAPGTKLLITSRVPMHLRGEREFPVSPLQVPPMSGVPLGEALDYDAVTLFRRQARIVRPSFEIGQENQGAVMDICRRLDGLPLAIEIAAARINMLTPQALLSRLDHSLDVLIGKAQDAPDRQQTMRGAIDWSYELLEPSLKGAFMRLGIFSGGFSLEAAESICRPMESEEVFSAVENLLDNSMLRRAQSVDDEPRFEMLQTLREYALEEASEEAILDELQVGHCSYFAQLAASVQGGGVYGAESGFWLKRFEEEHDNYRQALAWALDHPDQGVIPMIVMMSQLTWFWYRQGYLQEGTEWTERALKATEGMGESFERAYALTGRAMLALWSGDLLVAESTGRESVEMAERLKLDDIIPTAKLAYGTTLINQGRHKEAYPQLVDAVELFDEQDNSWFKGTVLVHLANVSLGMGNPTEALQWLDTALPLLRQTGDIWNMAFGMNNYGEVARVQGDYEKAEAFYKKTQALFEQADAKGDQARLVHSFGYIAIHQGEYEKARSLFQKSLEDFRKLGNHRGIAECLAGLAGLAAEQGNAAWGIPLLSAAESQLAEIGGAWWPADRVEIDRARELMHSAVPERYANLWQQGQSMTFEETLAYATPDS
jgi:predicted ATPase